MSIQAAKAPFAPSRRNCSPSFEFLDEFRSNTFFNQNYWVVHDKGGCFVEGGENIFKKHGIGNVAIEPPKVHHFLSLYDNEWHRVAKSIWRGRRGEYHCDAISNSCIAHGPQKRSKKEH